MLAQVALPLVYWDDYFYATVFIINKLPTLVLQYKNPLEIFFRVKPKFEFLKVFRCLCFPFIRPYDNHKLHFHLFLSHF